MNSLKVLVLSTAVLTLCWATPPPGYVKKPDNDKDPPKYEFGYDVRDGKGGRQGHLETRDGVYALGMYYVNLPDGSGQSVRYFADDWGYHPLVSYSSASDSGSSKTHFALGEKAVAALSKTKDTSKITPSGLTADTVAGNALKLQAEVSSGPKNGEILKIRHGKKPAHTSSVGGSESSPVSSNQETSHPTDSQRIDVSAVNNLVDSNVDRNGNVKYDTTTPVYTATQLVPESGYSSTAFGGSSNYESQQEYEGNDGTKGTGSSSYQLVEIGSESSKSGNQVSGTQTLFLPLISESHNTESGKSSSYNTGRKQKVSSFVSNKNSVLQFGDKLPNTGVYSSQSTTNGETEQNEIYKEEQKILKAAPTPAPQQYSSLRPIVVAEIYPKEEQKEVTQTLRPIVVSPTSPTSLHISHSPKASSSFTYSSSKGDSKLSSSSIGDSQESEGGGYSSDSDLSQSSRTSNENLSQYVVSHTHSTPKPAVVSYSQETSSSYSSSQNDGGASVAIQKENEAYAEPLIYTTPSPILLSYSQSTSHSSSDEGVGNSQSIITSNDGNSGHISSSMKQTASPIILLYSQPPLIHYSASSASEQGTGYVSSTPASILLSQSQESSSSVITSSGSEENTQQSVSTINNIVSQHSSPASVYVSHSPQSSSFSVSSSDSSQSSGTISATNNGNSGQIQNNVVHSTTARPTIVSLGSKSEGISAQSYAVSSTPAPAILESNYLSVPPVLTSSVLAPIQAGVSLGATFHQQHSVPISPVHSVTAEPPQVKEEVDDVPQDKTVVEIQKAISLDFNTLTKASQEQKVLQIDSAQPESASYIQQEGAKQEVQVNTIQQNVDSGNLIQYTYAQPLGLHIGYNQPIPQPGHLFYAYNPQIFESHKIQSISNNQEQVQNEVHYAPNEQLVHSGKQETENSEKNVGNVVVEYQKQKVVEPEENSQKYQYAEQLTIQPENSQENQQHVDIGKQQVTTTYNQQSASGEHQILNQQQLPEVTHVQAVYNQPLDHTENQIHGLNPPVQQIFHQPLQVSQPTHIQFPVDYQTQQINQNVEFQTPEINQQIGATAFAQQSSQTNVQLSQTNNQVTQSSSQVKPAYSKHPGEITKQLQSEYNHQLKEEEQQEQAKFSSQINEYNHIGNQGKSVLSTALAAEIDYQQGHVIQEPEEGTKAIEPEKPTSVHQPKIIEKPIAVPQPVPVEVTKLVAVEKPVPYPQPYAIPHPVPVPYAVPHPIGIPVPHLVPYPHVVAVPYKEIHPIYFQGKHNKHETATYHYETQNFPKDTPLPTILKSLQYQGGRYGVPVSLKSHHFHSSRTPGSIYLSPPPLKSIGRGREQQHSKYHDHFRTLCLEYGFKPPLIPSIQIDEVPASAYGPPQKL